MLNCPANLTDLNFPDPNFPNQALEWPVARMARPVTRTARPVMAAITGLAGLLLALFLAPLPQAQAEVPSRTPLQVVNVASDDVLNLREAPNARSAIVGEMPPGSPAAFTVGPSQGDWLYVRHDLAEGWARALLDRHRGGRGARGGWVLAFVRPSNRYSKRATFGPA